MDESMGLGSSGGKENLTIDAWQKAAHSLAVEKGWHSHKCPVCCGTGEHKISPTGELRLGSRLALLHAEVSEAVECVVRGEVTLSVRGGKPEGLPVELSDVFLRLCDLAESLGIAMREPKAEVWLFRTLQQRCVPGDAEHVASALNELHRALARSASDLDQLCQRTLDTLFTIAQWLQVDLYAVAKMKHEYNKTRPYRHGGKRL